jgi:Fic family protein
MLFQVPDLPSNYSQVIDSIIELRTRMRFSLSDSLNRWRGFLARMSYASAIQQSNTIEGINATFEEAVAAVDDEAPQNPEDENTRALHGYRDAMNYIIQLSKEQPQHRHNLGTLNALHFMVVKYDLGKQPGRIRTGPVHVSNSESGRTVYEGPPPEEVPGLLDELMTCLNMPKDCSVLIRAAMAHLNLAMIHPWKDGNGRMARALQTFVLAQEGILDPRFSSIEEYVGKNSTEYYRVLGEVGQGAWHPEHSALPWIKFCLRAHHWQATSLLRRLEQAESLWMLLDDQRKKRGLPERTMNALMKAGYGLKVRNPSYRQESEISVQVAKIDLKSLVLSGLLEPKGERRGRYYIASTLLLSLRQQSRIKADVTDPFEELSISIKEEAANDSGNEQIKRPA